MLDDSAQHFSHSPEKHDKEKRSRGGVDEDDKNADPQCVRVGAAASINEEEPQRDGGQ